MTHVKPPSPGQSRNIRLDGLRGLAILAVVLYHLGLNFHATSKPEYALETLLHMGWAGVDLFFVLSGYLITGILLRTRESPDYFRNFYARRILRILPLYFLVLTFFLLIVPNLLIILHPTDFWLPGADHDQAWYWVFLSNIHIALTNQFQHATLGVTWSLSVEEHFYLVWPLIVLLVSRNNLVLICTMLIFLSPAIRALMLSSDVPTLAVFVMTYARLDGLAAGALIALLTTEKGKYAKLEKWSKIMLPLSALALVALVVAIRNDTGIIIDDIKKTLFGHPWMQTIGYSLVIIFSASLLVRLIHHHHTNWLDRLFASRIFTTLGKYSYAMYLFHSFVIIMTGTYLFDYRRYPEWGLASFAAFALLAILLTLVLAWISWQVIEAPCLRLKRYFPYHPRETSSTDQSEIK